MRQTRIRFTFAVLLTYIAIICLLIPSITDTLNKYHAAKDIASYSEEIAHESDIEEKIKEAEEYNEELYEYSKTNGNQFLLKNSNYFEILDLKNSHVLCP